MYLPKNTYRLLFDSSPFPLVGYLKAFHYLKHSSKMLSALIDLFFFFFFILFPKSLQVSDVWYGCTLNYIQCSSCGLINSKLEKTLNFSLHITYLSAGVESILEHFC